MLLIKTITYHQKESRDYPFCLPLLKKFTSLEFDSPMTILVGENGTGKSTLLEGIATAVGSATVGGESVHTDPSLAPAREFAKHLKLSWAKKATRGFFMRSEDFFNFAKRMHEMHKEMEEELARVKDEYKGKPRLTQELARAAFSGSQDAIETRYGENLDARSHGEAFLRLFEARFVPRGLYLLDEPEAPLSPLRQYTLMMYFKNMVEQGAQFIVATHSPVLMAYPGAAIYDCSGETLHRTSYEELEHVSFMKAFLANPENFTRRL
jgi:predicted ATPase